MSEDIRRLSEELARDPSSLVFLRLGDALRRAGQADYALRVVLRGLERHPTNPDAHDLLARIALERGEIERAGDEWDIVLRLVPSHSGALRGLGFIRYQQNQLADAERYLAAAVDADPDDARARTALEVVRERRGLASSPSTDIVSAVPPAIADDARHLFADVIGKGDQTVLLVDATGLVLAGTYVAGDGQDVAQQVGAELSGVGDEARRAMRHLSLGDWTAITFETDSAIVAMAPLPDDSVVVLAADPATPLGLIRRLLARGGDRARRWLELAS